MKENDEEMNVCENNQCSEEDFATEPDDSIVNSNNKDIYLNKRGILSKMSLNMIY